MERTDPRRPRVYSWRGLVRISKRRLYELAERDDDPLPLRTFPGAKRGSIADRRELRDWVLRNTVLVREREQRG